MSILSHTRQIASPWIRIVLASAAAALSIIYPLWWFLAPISLALFFYDLWKTSSWKRVLLHGFLFGLAASSAGAIWFWDTLPLDWLGVQAGHQEYFVFASFAEVVTTLALTSALFSLPIWLLRKSTYAPLLAALLWVLLEEAKMWSFSLLTYAERSLLGPHFSSTALGYPLAENSYLLQIAQGGGLYFLDFTVALLGGVAAYILLYVTKKKIRVIQTEIAILAVLALVLSYPLWQSVPPEKTSSLKVGIYTSDLPLIGKKEDRTNSYLEALSSVEKTVPDADLILLPEEIGLEPTFPSAGAKRTAVQSILGDEPVLIASSLHRANDAGSTLILSYDLSDGTHLGEYEKRFLMPGGEYMPLVMEWAFSLFPDRAFTAHEEHLEKRTRPDGSLAAVTYEGHVVTGLICSDFLSPQLYTEAVHTSGADVLINLANPAWFHKSHTLQDKTLQISKVHAVQHRAYFLHSSNGSPSFALDRYGRVIAEMPWNTTGTLSITIP